MNCSFDIAEPSVVRCEALDDSGQPKDFVAKTAYIISGDGPQWAEVGFATTGVGKWTVRKDSNLKPSFAVALFNDQNEVLGDWVVDPAQAPPLQLADASFEDLKVNTTNDSTLLATEFLRPEAQKSWKASLATDTKCKIPYMEMKSNKQNYQANLGFFPSDGDQWVELDTTCSVPFDTVSNGGNIALYQDLTLAAGHIYEVIFDYKVKQPADSLQKISVKFGDETVLVKDVTEKDWTTYKFTRGVSRDAVRIEFEELGEDDGKGALLDNVRIYDLGVAPK